MGVRQMHVSCRGRAGVWCACAVLAWASLAGYARALEPCEIKVIDAECGWPVPLVELRTTHHVRMVTDNAGVVAFDLPELMNRETWLHVEGHGYGVPEDGFGYAGVRVTPRPGGEIVIKVERELPARRLGRITGGGLFAESQKLGREGGWREQGILGCDSVQNVVHGGRLFWAWGDTTLARYPLGRFHMIGAITGLRPLAAFEPPVRLRYDYFTDEEGTPRNIAKMPGEGPTWIDGLVSLPDSDGRRRLGATYAKINPPLEPYEFGLCVWNEQQREFEKLRVLWNKSEGAPRPRRRPHGHPVIWRDDSGAEHVLFGDPFPTLKCRATFGAWSDPSAWEQLDPQAREPARSGDRRVDPHRGAIAWSAYRDKWVAIFTEEGGEPSYLGEIWYAEADAPTGPWRDAVKVVTHSEYTFYNPQLHAGFTGADSPVLLFEATYTHTFSGNRQPTPRHDYNQVLYRLDLDDPALSLD